MGWLKAMPGHARTLRKKKTNAVMSDDIELAPLPAWNPHTFWKEKIQATKLKFKQACGFTFTLLFPLPGLQPPLCSLQSVTCFYSVSKSSWLALKGIVRFRQRQQCNKLSL